MKRHVVFVVCSIVVIGAWIGIADVRAATPENQEIAEAIREETEILFFFFMTSNNFQPAEEEISSQEVVASLPAQCRVAFNVKAYKAIIEYAWEREGSITPGVARVMQRVKHRIRAYATEHLGDGKPPLSAAEEAELEHILVERPGITFLRCVEHLAAQSE